MTTNAHQGPATDDYLDLARSVAGTEDETSAMKHVTRFAVEYVTGADAAGLTLTTRNGLATVAATSDLPNQVDALQYVHGGPCVEALTSADVIQHVPDLATDPRWPLLAQAALAQTPVHSILSCRLSVAAEPPVGSLNLYARSHHAFDAEAVRTLERLGVQAGVALAYVRERGSARTLVEAVHSNRDIGAAVGILMCRRRLTQDEAFALLRRTSQGTNHRLRALAERVLQQGDLPR